MRQRTFRNLSQWLVKICRHLPPYVTGICRNLSPFAAVRGALSSDFNFHLLATTVFADELFCRLMTETAQRKRGGRAFHSILEPHLDFIHQQRQRRKTWQEIADLLLTEKGVRVTLYAPYHFYRRRLERASHWENSSVAFQPVRPSAATRRPQSRPAPLPASTDFKRPNLSTINTEEFT